MQARRVQMIIACNLIARLTGSKPSINFSALDVLTCAAFSGQATHPSSIGADSSIWQQVAENSCQRRGDVIEAQAGAVCDGQLGGYRSHWMPPAGYAGELSNLGNQVVGAIVRLNLTAVARSRLCPPCRGQRQRQTRPGRRASPSVHAISAAFMARTPHLSAVAHGGEAACPAATCRGRHWWAASSRNDGRVHPESARQGCRWWSRDKF